MLRSIFFICIIASCCSHAVDCYSQEVDLVRLGYSGTDITSGQIGMAASPDGNNIVFIYADQTVKIFDVTAGKFVKKFRGPYAELFDVYLTSTGAVVLISNKELQIWDWKKESLVAKFTLAETATKAALAPKLNLLAIGQKDGITSVFDLNSLKLVRHITISKFHHIGAVAFHPNGTDVVIGGIIASNFSPQPLLMFDITTGIEKVKSAEKGYFTMVAFNESGSQLMAAGLNGSVTKTLLMTLDGKDLTLKKKFDSESNISNSRVPYGGLLRGNRLFAVTLAQAFNANDSETGALMFTTKSEKNKIPPFPRFGVGSFNVFPLQNDGRKVLLNSTKNNINQIYDAESNAIIGYFFSDSNDDFAIVSRDGRVDGTPQALSRLYWTSRNSSKKTSLESTFTQKFSPRLLSQMLSENTSGQVVFEVDDVVGKIPVLSLKSVNGNTASPGSGIFQSPQKKIQVVIEVKQNFSEVKELRLYQNAKLIHSVSGQSDPKFPFDVVLNSSFGEDNFFYATATSKSGIEAEKIKFVVNYKGVTNEKPNLYLITVGINQYKNPKYNLNYAQADAEKVQEVMKLSSSSLFNEVFSYALLNDKAIKANIVSAFEEVRKNALEQDVLFVYYAGHGVMSEGSVKPSEFYIVPFDITQLYGRDDILTEKGISADEIKTYARSINAQKQVFVLDACQSAGALESVGTRGAIEEKAIAQMARSTGTFWITASGSEQFATEFEKLGHGVFTYALLEGVQGKADSNGDRKLTIRELSTYIENRVPELSEQFNGLSQFPSAYSFGNDFPIVIYR
jgi:WD40 repeat protein